MKYIVTSLNDVEMIFTFPRSIDHDRMWEMIASIRFGTPQHWDRTLRGGEVISAGFVSNGKCHGHSETLQVCSRTLIDTALLQQSQSM